MVTLDMLEICRLSESRMLCRPVERSEPFVDLKRIKSDELLVVLQFSVICEVESDHGDG